MLTDFQNSFTGRLTGKFATNSYLNIPPHLKYVATLHRHSVYADDLKLYSLVESPIDPQTMQDALNRIFKWADTWQLGISYKKVFCFAYWFSQF